MTIKSIKGKMNKKLIHNYIIFISLITILSVKLSSFKVNDTYYDLRLFYFITLLAVSLCFLYKIYKSKGITYHD